MIRGFSLFWVGGGIVEWRGRRRGLPVPGGSVTCPVVSGAGRGGVGTRSGWAGRRDDGAGTVRAGAGASAAVAGGTDGVRRGGAPPGSAFGLRAGRDVRLPFVRAGGCRAHDASKKRLRHLDFFQHRGHLHVRVPRVRFPECGVRRAKVPWSEPGPGFTCGSRRLWWLWRGRCR